MTEYIKKNTLCELQFWTAMAIISVYCAAVRGEISIHD